MIDGGAASDVLACLGFGRMSSFIRQINTSLREFEREPGHERRIEKKIKNKQTFFYAGWLEGGNEGGKKVCSACCVPSQAAALMAPRPGAFKLLVPCHLSCLADAPGLVLGRSTEQWLLEIGTCPGVLWMQPLLSFSWVMQRGSTHLAPR